MSASVSLQSAKTKGKMITFPTQILQTLTPQQLKFADEQFRKIYAEQMSKLSRQIQKKKKVKQNQQLKGNDDIKNHQQKYQKVIKKMDQTQKKRQENMEKKIKSLKLSEERWKFKLQQIHRSVKNKNKIAFQKAAQYRHESQQFWKNRKIKLFSTSKESLISLENSHVTIKNQHAKDKSKHPKPQFPAISQDRVKKVHKRQYSRTEHTPIKNRNIDDQIREHKQKALHLQETKQEQAIQNALKKLSRIQKSRKTKKIEGKQSQPTVARQALQSLKTVPAQRSRKNQDRKEHLIKISQSRIVRGQSQDHLHQRVPIQLDIQKHQIAKQKKQHAEFIHRGEVLQKSLQRNKKNKIMKIIKQRVYKMKFDAQLKMQNQ